jgi:hypothetical protein
MTVELRPVLERMLGLLVGLELDSILDEAVHLV